MHLSISCVKTLCLALACRAHGNFLRSPVNMMCASRRSLCVHNLGLGAFRHLFLAYFNFMASHSACDCTCVCLSVPSHSRRPTCACLKLLSETPRVEIIPPPTPQAVNYITASQMRLKTGSPRRYTANVAAATHDA